MFLVRKKKKHNQLIFVHCLIQKGKTPRRLTSAAADWRWTWENRHCEAIWSPCAAPLTRCCCCCCPARSWSPALTLAPSAVTLHIHKKKKSFRNRYRSCGYIEQKTLSTKVVSRQKELGINAHCLYPYLTFSSGEQKSVSSLELRDVILVLFKNEKWYPCCLFVPGPCSPTS